MANPYVAILGKPENASSRLSLSQAVNSLGHTIASIFGSIVILLTAVKSSSELAGLSPAEVEVYRMTEVTSVQYPYLYLIVTLITISIII